MHMSAVIGSAALFLNWEHEVTPLSEEIEIIATLFPKVRPDYLSSSTLSLVL